MKNITFLALIFVTYIISPSVFASTTLDLPVAQPKIIGGVISEEEQWPWMSTIVNSYSQISSSLVIDSSTYSSETFTYSPLGQVSATLIDCGIGDKQCTNATNKICLISRGDINFSVKANNCEAGGGIGVIIYNNTIGSINGGTLGRDFSGEIPVVGISQVDGNTLLNNLDKLATLAVNNEDILISLPSCGATFLGEKWVLTAAHCVDGIDTTSIKVSVGEYDLTTTSNYKTIKSVYVHPQYNVGSSFNNDIAIIELIETVDNSAVTLLDLEETEQLAEDNSLATVIGFGNQTAYGPEDDMPDNDQPNTLYEVEVSLLTNLECKTKLADSYSDLYNTNYSLNQVGITESMICTDVASGGKGSCQGDSGGPLLVETNLGWQQIGIVSYGVGCALSEFPDVYTRVGLFTDWVNSITQGIAIDTNYTFPITPQFANQTTQLTVKNNSDVSANLTFSVSGINATAENFSLNDENCLTLTAKESCSLQLNFDASSIGQFDVSILINSDNKDIPTTESLISAQVIGANTDIQAQLSNNNSNVSWYSGGDEIWELENTDAAISSGDINNNQESSVLLTFTGAANVSFEWAVSSEENTDNPETPFDALYLLVDGEQTDFISGEVDYTPVSIDISSEGVHQITWLYKKDYLTSAGEDKAYLKNVIVTQTASTEIAQSDDSGSSGGSVYWLLVLINLITIYRYTYHLNH